jgi:NDP-sugar pyrophosphorylase family protein
MPVLLLVGGLQSVRAVILAGGKGTRLAPYTTILPKPLLPVGDVPILEVVVRQLAHHGFEDIALAVGHLGELIMAYFGDGSKHNVRLGYSREPTPLGTAGPITLVPDLDETFLVMNGDLLTTLDYGAMWRYHKQRGAVATLASHRRDVFVELGVIECDEDNWVTDYIEKPTLHYDASMGIYIFEPEVLRHIPANQYFDLPELMIRLRENGAKVNRYVHDGYWFDVGSYNDYQSAILEFEKCQQLFLPDE